MVKQLQIETFHKMIEIINRAAQLVQRTDLFELRLSLSHSAWVLRYIFISIISTQIKTYRQTKRKTYIYTHTQTHTHSLHYTTQLKQPTCMMLREKEQESTYSRIFIRPTESKWAFMKWILCDERHNFPIQLYYIFHFTYYFFLWILVQSLIYIFHITSPCSSFIIWFLLIVFSFPFWTRKEKTQMHTSKFANNHNVIFILSWNWSSLFVLFCFNKKNSKTFHFSKFLLHS